MNKKTIAVLSSITLLIIGFSFLGCGNTSIEVSSEPVSQTTVNIKPILNVYIENSGSMDGYMCAGSELKDALYDYVSDLNRYTDTTRLFYINSMVIPYRGNLQTYIRDLEPVKFRKAGGNTSSSDMGALLGKVFGSVEENTVSIFVSDCILDLPSSNAQDFLTNCEITIKQETIETIKRVPDLGIEILKLISKFNGKYFYPNGSIEVLTNVQRPYYMWIIGDKRLIAELNNKVPLSMLKKYNLSEEVAFSNESGIPFEIRNEGLTSGVIKAANGAYHAIIRANFSNTLQPAEAVTNKNNYMVGSAGIKIESIREITEKSSPYTHYINISIPNDMRINHTNIIFKNPGMPEWVGMSNDESAVDIKENLDKTTGIKYLIEGVADAYRTQEVSAKFNFNIKRK